MNTTDTEITLTVDTNTRRVTVTRRDEPPVDVFLTVRNPDNPRGQEGGSVRMTPQAAEAVAHALLGIDSPHDLDGYAARVFAKHRRDCHDGSTDGDCAACSTAVGAGSAFPLSGLDDLRAALNDALALACAEAAEARTAPAVPLHQPDGTRMDALHLPIDADDDPAVFVVRESDVAAVEVTRDSGGWYADGAWLASADKTAEWVRDRAAEMVVCAARNEAVARAIEAEQSAAVEEKARELYRAAIPDAMWETVAPEYRRIAAHVLGQEAKR